MTNKSLHSVFDDAWLMDGVRTPFVDYNGALASVSPTDLGIKVARFRCSSEQASRRMTSAP